MILLHKPYRTDLATGSIKACLEATWVSSAGPEVRKFEEKIAELCQTQYAVATSSGTAAIHLALIATGVEKGDQVIIPNLTFIASVNPIKYVGAEPILIDVEMDSWQMDLSLLEKFLEEKTHYDGNVVRLSENDAKIKAIMPVHLLGSVLDLDRLTEIAQRYHLTIIEDAAEAIGAKWNEKPAGSVGEVGCISFNGNKTITTGGGGMLITNDRDLAKTAKHLSTQAKSHSQEYFHDQVGFNYRMNNISAALGLSQLSLLSEILERKQKIDSFYRQSLPEFIFQKHANQASPNYWLTTIKSQQKKAILNSLNNQKIQARPLWLPLNRQPVYQNAMYVSEQDNAWKLYQSCVCLPSSPDLTEEELKKIISIIREYR